MADIADEDVVGIIAETVVDIAAAGKRQIFNMGRQTEGCDGIYGIRAFVLLLDNHVFAVADVKRIIAQATVKNGMAQAAE